jgi:hypothetical protein
MAEKQVAAEKISKALEQLQTLAKGHSSGSAPATKVESMRDAGVGAGSGAGSTQVHHTPSNSDQQSWAGSSWKASPEDGATDAIDANGTDYKGGAEMVKSILSKIAKGLPLNTEEAQVFAAFAKGDFGKDDKDEKAEKAFPPKMDAKKDGKDEDEDKDAKMGKSLSDHAQDNSDVQKGLELSSFLAGWADVQHSALTSTESRIVSTLRKSLSGLSESQESFNGDLAKSISALAEVLAIQSQRIEQLESTPARAPKSVTAVEKSFGAGGPAAAQSGEALSKSQVLNAMVDMVEKGKLSASAVVNFDTNSTLSPSVEQQVIAHLAGR